MIIKLASMRKKASFISPLLRGAFGLVKGVGTKAVVNAAPQAVNVAAKTALTPAVSAVVNASSKPLSTTAVSSFTAIPKVPLLSTPLPVKAATPAIVAPVVTKAPPPLNGIAENWMKNKFGMSDNAARYTGIGGMVGGGMGIDAAKKKLFNPAAVTQELPRVV